MILSGLEICQEIDRGNIVIAPFDAKRVNPNSYNLRLHNELMVYTDPILDMKKPNSTVSIVMPSEGILLQPGKLYLGRTVEYTKTNGFVPMLEGRSSLGRLGVSIHATAGFGDVGFAGYWTLEIHCVQPVRVYPYTEVCQIYYHTIHGKYENYADGKYNNNTGIQPSLFYLGFANENNDKNKNYRQAGWPDNRLPD